MTTTNLYNYNSGDYHDRYDRSTGWVKLLFNQGRPLQTTELIEMQSIIQDFLKQGMDNLFSNGSILSGLQITTLSVDTNVNLTISSGSFYIDGLIINIPSGTLSVPTTGDYNIGLLITPTIITEQDDPTLRDPIKGGALYGTPGAARLTWNTSFTSNDPTSFTIGKVSNGSIIQTQSNLFSKLDDALAESSYIRTGNFCVSGLSSSVLDGTQSVVNDVSQYNSLQSTASSTLTDTQNSYSQLLNYQQQVDSLTTQLNQATTAYQQTPTTSNLLVLQDVQARLNTANSNFDDASRVYVSKKVISDQAATNLSQASSLLVDKVYLSISPGVAYVEGYRIDINSPYIVEVPKVLDVSTVSNAIFTYAGSQASSLRTLSLATNALWSDVTSQYTSFTINFTKLLYNAVFVPLSISIDLGSHTSLTSISDLLDLLVSEVTKPISQSLSALSITSTYATTPEVLRTILQNNLIIQKVGSAINFTSTTINDEANQITVDIEIKQRDGAGNIIATSPVLLVDVVTANLSGASKSNSFQLGFRPVANIISLTAELQANLKPIVRGVVAGTSDTLGQNSIFQITQVTQGDVTFVEGQDYTLINQSQIDWSPNESNSQEPSPGTTYYVSFLYTQPLSFNTDYILNRDTDSIEFTNTTPAPNQKFYVDYSYYLAKAGVVTLDKNGTISYLLSPSSLNPITPNVAPNLLTLSTFTLFANNTNVLDTDCKLLSFSQLQSLVQQVKRNSKDIEQLKLQNNAELIAYNNDITPIGYYNTTLQDLTSLNLTHPLFTGAISPGIQALTGGYVSKDVSVKYTSGGNVLSNEFGIPVYVSIPYLTTPLYSQDRITTTRDIIPNITGINKRSKLSIYPQFSFLNTGNKLFTACDVLSQATTVLTRVSDNKPLILQNISTNVINLFKSFGEKIYNSFIDLNPLGNSNQDLTSFIGYIGSLIKPQSLTVSLLVENLSPSTDGYRLYLSGKEVVNYTLTNGTPLSVIYPGTMKSKTDGTLSLTFPLPTGLYCGVHSIEIISDGNAGYAKGQISIYNNLYSQIILDALDNWDISFNKPTITTLPVKSKPSYFDSPFVNSSNSLVSPGTIPSFTVTTPLPEQQFPVLYDSLMQTFKVYDYCYLTQVLIKLSSISLTDPLILNLGYTDSSSSPDRSYILSATTSTYSTNINNWTTFTFTYPVFLDYQKQYSLSLISKSSGYTVYTAEIGAKDLITNQYIGDQLYLEGNLYISNDGRSLDKYDREDLAFQLNTATFDLTNPVTVNLGNYGIYDNLSYVTSFCLNTRDILPPNTFIQYQYQIIDTTTWITFDSNSLVCLPNPSTSITLQAILTSTQSNVSPYLCLEGTSVSLYLGLDSSSIISNQNIYTSPYTNVNILLTYLQPPETTITVYYSPNDGLVVDGQEWFQLTKDTNTDTFIDQGLNIKQALWNYTNDSEYTSTSEARTKFRYRIDFATTNKAIQPTVKDIVTYVF